MKVLMVCLGNICRSPLAHGILEHKIHQQNLLWQVDSAGTSNYHIGALPDKRSIEIASKHGIDITNQQARQFQVSDFQEFDLIYAMDSSNYSNIIKLAKNEEDKAKVRLILNETNPNQNQQVPDPYYGGEQGFKNVYDLLDLATDNLIKRLTKKEKR